MTQNKKHFNEFLLDDNLIETDKLPDNQLKLSNGKIITLNDQQYDGIKKIRKWLNSKDKYFCLAGVAGSGKSTIIKKILDEYKYGVVVSAPTHKARKVIQKTTGREGKTLSSLLGLRADIQLDAFNPNSPIFNPIAIATISDFNLCVVDESSMINNFLYDLIIEKTISARTKVLFVGDPCQIPPIGEAISAPFVKDIQSHWLLKPERQSYSNPMMVIYDAIRENLNILDGGYKRISNMNDSGEGIIFTTDKLEFRKNILDKFSSTESKTNIDFVKLIAWRNETVRQSNQIIRKELITNNDDVIAVGDIVMSYRTVIDKLYHPIIENSADYRVVDRSNLEENKFGLFGYNVKLCEEIGDGEFKYINMFIINTNNFNDLNLYADIHDSLRDQAKTNKKLWKNYYEFRRSNLIMTDIKQYRNGLLRSDYDIITKDLDFSYCLTAHKVQGSTLNHVGILENDINMNWITSEKNKILYVSYTRPITSAMVLSSRIDE